MRLPAVDMAGRITEFNPAYQALLGYTAEELRQKTYVDLTPQKWHAIEARIVTEQISRAGYSEVYEKEYRRKDGTIFPVELRTFLIRDANGQPAAMWAIVRDITERKRRSRRCARRMTNWSGGCRSARQNCRLPTPRWPRARSATVRW